ncbi:MAG: hypothetical protein K1X88_01850, partial [Nannocystaceae bacterium]|nr:hypothetical protein [Nannocystaceae bacterium]
PAVVPSPSPVAAPHEPARADCPPEPGLPPEPQAPQIECIVEPVTRCVPPSPVRSAWQPEPFTQCPREIPPWVDDAMQQPGRFSAVATRSRRLGSTCAATPSEGECCYVQFTGHVCR